VGYEKQFIMMSFLGPNLLVKDVDCATEWITNDHPPLTQVKPYFQNGPLHDQVRGCKN